MTLRLVPPQTSAYLSLPCRTRQQMITQANRDMIDADAAALKEGDPAKLRHHVARYGLCHLRIMILLGAGMDGRLPSAPAVQAAE